MAENNGDRRNHRIENWRQGEIWPKEYFEPGDQPWWEELEAKRLAEEHHDKEEWYREQAAQMENPARPLLVRKRSSASLRRQNAELGMDTPTDSLKEEKSAKYKNPEYEKDLKDIGNSYLCESDLDVTDESKSLCQNLLNSAQTVVQDSIFCDDRFRKACEKIQNRNEAKVIQDVTRLIVPSAETLATCGATSLKHLIENVNEGWNKVIPVTDTRPQPDYSVGFQESAFTDEQLQKLKPLVGGSAELCYVMATWRMYFPFLTCEVKCGAMALDVADRQNAHSMTCAVRAVVELYRYANRYARWDEELGWQKQLNREILAFSISHDDRSVGIYGHYPVFEGDKTAFYRHPIREFSLTDLEGRDKWTAYIFTKNVYEIWMPDHLKRITKAIDAIPTGLDFGVPSASFGSNTGVDTETEPSSQEMAASTPLSQGTERLKKARLKPAAMLQQESDWLKEQLAQGRQESERQRQEMNSQLNALIQQMERQRQESERQRQESERQRLEMKEENEGLKQQINKLMETLTQSLLAPPKQSAKK